MASKSPNLPRPTSLPDLRPSPETSSRPSLIATLEPFQAPSGTKGASASSFLIPRPGGSRTKSRKQGPKNVPVSQSSQVEVLPGLFESVSYDKYITVKSLDGRSVNDLDIFEVHRELVKTCGREPKMLPQGDGSLLVEVSSPEESERLRALTSVPGAAVSCAPHATMNQSRGVVFSRDLLRYSEERLVKELEEYDVVAVRRVHKKEEGALTPTPTLFITFNRLELPRTVKLAWLNLHVKPYVPNPRRCFHCQLYGHVTRTCRRLQNGLPKVCVTCGRDDHGEECPGPVRCYHCAEPHPASSKECDRLRFEREVLTIRNKEKLSFVEAKRLALTRLSSPGRTYASVLQSHAQRRLKTSQDMSCPAAPVVSVSTPLPEITPNRVPLRTEPQQQKRSRSEESLDETPPTKLQTPAPVVGSPEVPRASAAAAAPAPAAPAVCGPESAGAQACGASLPAPVASTSGESSPGTSSASSSSAATSEWRTVGRGGRGKTPAAVAGRRVVECPQPANRSAVHMVSQPATARTKGPLMKGDGPFKRNPVGAGRFLSGRAPKHLTK